MDALKGAQQALGGGHDFGSRAKYVARRRGAGATQMMVDVALHDRRLTRRGFGQRSLGPGGLVAEHGKGRLQGMREIADMGPGALEHRRILLQESINFRRQWIDFRWEFPLQTMRRSRADGAQRRLDPCQRPEPVTDLHENGDDKDEAERRQRPGQRRIERRDIGLHRRDVAGDGIDIALVRTGKGDRPLQHANGPFSRTGGLERRRPLAPAGGARVPGLERLVPERARAQDRAVGVGDLPIPSREGLAEPRARRRLGEAQGIAGSDLADGDEGLDQDVEAGVETALDGIGEQGRQQVAARGQGRRDPQPGAKNQADGKRLRTHPGRPLSRPRLRRPSPPPPPGGSRGRAPSR